jgi:hypothetical protein
MVRKFHRPDSKNPRLEGGSKSRPDARVTLQDIGDLNFDAVYLPVHKRLSFYTLS